MRVSTSTVVHASPGVVRAVYADHTGWPTVFPTISAVRVHHHRGATVVLELDHVEGVVINELTSSPDGTLVLHEVKRRYVAVFVNRFDPDPAGTLFTVDARLSLKGAVRLLEPVLGPYVRRQIRLLQLDPVRARAERGHGNGQG